MHGNFTGTVIYEEDDRPMPSDESVLNRTATASKTPGGRDARKFSCNNEKGIFSYYFDGSPFEFKTEPKDKTPSAIADEVVQAIGKRHDLAHVALPALIEVMDKFNELATHLPSAFQVPNALGDGIRVGASNEVPEAHQATRRSSQVFDIAPNGVVALHIEQFFPIFDHKEMSNASNAVLGYIQITRAYHYDPCSTTWHFDGMQVRADAEAIEYEERLVETFTTKSDVYVRRMTGKETPWEWVKRVIRAFLRLIADFFTGRLFVKTAEDAKDVGGGKPPVSSNEVEMRGDAAGPQSVKGNGTSKPASADDGKPHP